MTDTNYAYAVGRVRVLETRLLDKSKLERMIEADSAEEALKVLAETEYAGAVSEMASVHDFEQMLHAEMSRTISVLHRSSPQPDLIKMMALRYDVHNLKVLFKAKFMNAKTEMLLLPGNIALEKLRRMVDEEVFRDLPGALRGAAKQVVDEFSASQDPQVIDLILDRSLYEMLLGYAREARSAFMEGFIVRLIDLSNLKTFIRVKRMKKDRKFLKQVLLPGGALTEDRLVALLEEPLESLSTHLQTSNYLTVADEGVRDWIERGTAVRLEKLSDDYITEHMRRHKGNPFGLEPLIGYLWGKEIEIKNIRLILVGKINRLPTGAIRERIRDVYA